MLEAINNLRGNPDFGVLMASIADNAGTGNERLIRQATGDEYLRGQVFALSDLLETVNKAPGNLKKALGPKT